MQISASITQEQYEHIHSVAVELGISFSAALRIVLNQIIKKG